MAKKKVTKKKAKKKKVTKKKAARSVGRPSQFTEEMREKIYEALNSVPFISFAAEKAGIRRETIHAWINQGVKDFDAGLDTEFIAFSNRLRYIIAGAEDSLFGVVKNEARTNWGAAKYILSCMKPKLYGAKTAVKVEDETTTDGAFDGDNIHAALAGLVAKHEGENGET